MITFITDCREGEPDILTPVMYETLLVTDLNGVELFSLPAPVGGWTTESLNSLSSQYRDLNESGAEAYIGDVWVGSTEV